MIQPISAESIYLDHAATTPVDPGVLQLMLPYFTEQFGNPSSIYQTGQAARAALDLARSRVARTLRVKPQEIVFTSGASESNNLALVGSVMAANRRSKGVPHLITSATEHHAVLDTALWTKHLGAEITVLPCDPFGRVDPDQVRLAITPETCLISIMYANNEAGTVQPIDEISAIAREAGVAFHTDATQAPGLLPLDLSTLPVSMLSLSAHKHYGPKGVGLLVVRDGTAIEFLQHGGGQEGGRRAGTENVPLIVGLSHSLEQAVATRDAYAHHCGALRDALWSSLQAEIDDLSLNGMPFGSGRLANNLNFAISGVQGETMLLSLDMLGVEVSAGSACTTGNTTPSHVLMAMGLGEIAARSSLRVSVGRCNTHDQIEEIVDAFAESVSRIRDLARV